jgi:hypothetical protein
MPAQLSLLEVLEKTPKQIRRRAMQNAAARKWRAANLEKRRAYERAWYEKQKQKDPLFISKKRNANLDNTRRIQRECVARKRKSDPAFKAQCVEQTKLWRNKNPEKSKQLCRDWSRANYEKKKTLTKLWILKNQDRYRAYSNAIAAKRRFRKRNQAYPQADEAKIKEFYAKAVAFEKTSGMPADVDHIIPLVHGGFEHEENLQILPKSINRSKGSNPFWMMPGFKSWRDVPRNLWPVSLVPFFLVAERLLETGALKHGH